MNIIRISQIDDESIIEFKRPLMLDKQKELEQTADIVEQVRKNGDEALLAYTRQLDGVGIIRTVDLRVNQSDIDAAYANVSDEFRRALTRAHQNITTFHSQNLPDDWQIKQDGVTVGQRIKPLRRIGAYVPGGRAAYPSTLLMTTVPAKVAGVKEIMVCCPPDSSGQVNPYTLAAAKIAGITEIYRVGGAQAIAAMAYGTETIPKVDKICGPGNLYVTLAKRLVIGEVGIDMLAGPSEIVIIADDTANPRFIAYDMFAQAEHDPNASAWLITDSLPLAEKVQTALNVEIEKLQRRDTIKASLETNGRIFVVSDLREAFRLADWLAPEHLELCVADPQAALDEIDNAGAVFMGSFTPEALGDYMAGPNHVLPTAGTARFASVLTTDDFFKKTSVIWADRDRISALAPSIDIIAKAEGLEAHGLSVQVRSEAGFDEA